MLTTENCFKTDPTEKMWPLLALLLTLTCCVYGNQERDLIAGLRRNRTLMYGDAPPYPRPVTDSRTAVRVKFSLGITQVIELEEDKQTLSIGFWEMIVSNINRRSV